MATVLILDFQAGDTAHREVAAGLSTSGHEVRVHDVTLTTELSKQLQWAQIVIIPVSDKTRKSPAFEPTVQIVSGYSVELGKPLLLGLVTSSVPDTKLPPGTTTVSAVGEDNKAVVRELDRIANRFAGRIVAEAERKEEQAAQRTRSVDEFVSRSVNDLNKRVRRNACLAMTCYLIAALSLGGGLYLAYSRLDTLPATVATWPTAIAHVAVAVVVIGFVGSLSRLGFLLGKCFMQEAIRNADRRHAISFGQLYLTAFAERREWGEIKDAFQHWNIDKGTGFSDLSVKDIDLPTLTLLAKFMETVKSNKAQ